MNTEFIKRINDKLKGNSEIKAKLKELEEILIKEIEELFNEAGINDKWKNDYDIQPHAGRVYSGPPISRSLEIQNAINDLIVKNPKTIDKINKIVEYHFQYTRLSYDSPNSAKLSKYWTMQLFWRISQLGSSMEFYNKIKNQ